MAVFGRRTPFLPIYGIPPGFSGTVYNVSVTLAEVDDLLAASALDAVGAVSPAIAAAALTSSLGAFVGTLTHSATLDIAPVGSVDFLSALALASQEAISQLGTVGTDASGSFSTLVGITPSALQTHASQVSLALAAALAAKGYILGPDAVKFIQQVVTQGVFKYLLARAPHIAGQALTLPMVFREASFQPHFTLDASLQAHFINEDIRWTSTN